jgi:hypothetical protein
MTCHYLDGFFRCSKSTFKRCEQVKKEGRCFMERLEAEINAQR